MTWMPARDKRQSERFKVRWTGTLNCLFPNFEADVEVCVTEVSANGARLELKTLRVGPHHLVTGSESSLFTLNVGLPEISFLAPVRIVWYSTDQERDLFNIGVIFVQQSEERRAAIERLVADLALEASPC